MSARNNIDVSYDPEADVLSLASSPNAPIDHASEMGNLVGHCGKDSEPVLVEILEASQALRRQIEPMSKAVQSAKSSLPISS